MIDKLLEKNSVSKILLIGFLATMVTGELSIRISDWFSIYQVVGLVAIGISYIYADKIEQQEFYEK